MSVQTALRQSNSFACEDFRPTASWPVLRLRAELLKKTRAFFDARGYLEVETPVLCSETVVDRHIDPFVINPGWSAPPLYLQSSPEACMKRLLAAGGNAIFQIARVFRRGEAGQYHNPEFTMVEWYRTGDDVFPAMLTTSDLISELLECFPASCRTYRDVFLEIVDVDPHLDGVDRLRQATCDHGIVPPASQPLEDRDGWLDLLMSEVIQPKLGLTSPECIYDYPASQAALAAIRDDEIPVAERFELFYRGHELANGYYELRDPEELAARALRQNSLRAADGKETFPQPRKLQAALQSGLPPCAGVSVGFDRVAMLAGGLESIEEVLPFPSANA